MDNYTVIADNIKLEESQEIITHFTHTSFHLMLTLENDVNSHSTQHRYH